MKILVVDDEADILNLLQHFLTSKDREVVTATNGQEALEVFSQENPNLVILDVMMPGMTGWDVLSTLRQFSQVPIIMLTAKGTPMDTAKGLLSGADDYVKKPFDLGEIEARITAVMRRYEQPLQQEQMQVGNLSIDNSTKEVTLNGEPANLSPKEYDLLRLLASQPGKVFSHDEIISEVWQGKHFVSPKDVIKYINLLRNKLEEDPKKPTLIVNVRGFGYKISL
jgi:DNA-binding response OmpR family regulator